MWAESCKNQLSDSWRTLASMWLNLLAWQRLLKHRCVSFSNLIKETPTISSELSDFMVIWNGNSLLNRCEVVGLDLAVYVEITQSTCPQIYSTKALELLDRDEYSCEFKHKALRHYQFPLFLFPFAAEVTWEDSGPDPLHVSGTVDRLFQRIMDGILAGNSLQHRQNFSVFFFSLGKKHASKCSPNSTFGMGIILCIQCHS